MKTIKQLLITVVMLLCSATASAYDFEVDGIYYNITSITDLTVEVTNGDNEYSDKVIIPETVVYKSKVLKVTSISRYAFNGCKNLTSVVIGNNVTSIIDETFSQCSNLTSVVIGNSVTSIGECAFERCSNLTNVVIGNSVTSIGVGAFNYCEGLTNIEIPNSVTSIKNSAFSCCFSLTSIAIGNSVTSIGEYAFSYCDFTSIKIPNSVTSIGDNAFDNCKFLKELCIEDGTETLSLGYSDSYRYDDHGLFYYCPLETLYLGRNLSYSSYYLPFEQNKTLTSVTIGNSVTNIGENAFYECSSLTSIEIPNSVTSIGENAFYECSSLTRIEIPNSVTNIGEKAFYRCSSLTSIEIPNSVTRIGDGAFSFCTGLKKIEFKCAKIGTWFNGLFIKEVEIDYRVTSIAGGAFKDCSSLTNIHLLGETPPSVESNTFAESQYATLTIYVPQGSLSTYQSSDVWKNFWDIREFYIDKYFYIRYFVDNVLFETDSIKHGAEIKLLDEPTKEGYTFSGWSEAPETMPAHDITIEGVFNVNYHAVTYIVDGELLATDSVAYGSELILRAEPTKEGYTFSGWSEAPETMPAKDITIEGSFAVNSYIVTYLVDGEEYARYTLEYGTEVPIPEVSSKVGYTFNWMNEIPATMPAHDVTIEGAFTANYYTVTYIVDGEVWATDSLAYGSEIVLCAEPTKEGYTFSGWSEAPETMPANDISIEGTFYVNNYTVTYIIDGEVYEEATVEYGAELELPSVPEKEGYTFSWMNEIPKTMPAKDIVIHGSYVADTAIEDIYLDLENIEVYNLKGVRITETDKLTRGVYIINGKKTFVK